MRAVVLRVVGRAAVEHDPAAHPVADHVARVPAAQRRGTVGEAGAAGQPLERGARDGERGLEAVITVGFGVDTDAGRELMQGCGSQYFEAANADELQDVFRRIAKSFTALRLTQ